MFFIKATLAKINVSREILVKIMRANVHPCDSFVGQMSTHANFQRGGGGQMSGGHMSVHPLYQMKAGSFSSK